MRRAVVWFSSVAIALALVVAARSARSDDDALAKELPRIKPLEPDAALKSFQVDVEFHLELVAAEPLVTDPVSACYDADGRLYVAEMRGYPYPENQPSGNVSLLVDRDGDGRFDTSTVFVDGLSWPTSVVPYDGGVFIAVAPDILYAKDTNGDGRADIRKIMFTGFGTQNVQGLVNGLLWGLDGWIYGVSGGNGGEIRNLTRPGSGPIGLRGRDFRFRPDGSAFEPTSGGGQFGHSFDDWGHRFTCNNSNHIRQIVLPAHYIDRNPALAVPSVIADIAAEGAAAPVFRSSPPEPWRVVRTRQRAADPDMVKRLPPTELVPTGFFTSATGITIYRGSQFPLGYDGSAFIGDVGGNLVHRKELSRNGPIYLASRLEKGVEFVSSTDNWFRPVNFVNTPGGTLLILDMYRETIEHPLSIPEPIKKHLDLTSGKDRGRLYELVGNAPRHLAKPALTNASVGELVIQLANPDGWWRETAQRLLLERRDRAAVPLLKALVAARPNGEGRMHALHVLDALGGLTLTELEQALLDIRPVVRESAAQLLERFARDPRALQYIADAAEDRDSMVRFQVAFSLGEFQGAEALNALASIARRDAGSLWFRLAIMSSIKGRTVAFLDALSADAPGYLDEPAGLRWLEELSALVAAENRRSDIELVLRKHGTANGGRAATRVHAILVGFARGFRRSGGSVREIFAGPGAEHLGAILASARETASSTRESGVRVEAIELIGMGPIDNALGVLPDLLDARHPTVVQLAAIQALANLPDKRVGDAIVAHWTALSPAIRREAVETLFARPDRLGALLDALEKKVISGSEIDPARRKQLVEHADQRISRRALALLGDPLAGDRAKVVAQFKQALELPGNRDRGREVFRKVCATCHRAEGHGVDVGPNLATVAGRPADNLLVHILDPNREVAAPYLNYTVATTDGRVLTGLIADESANSVTLKRAEGVADVVPRDRIEAIKSTGISLMPEGLEKGLEPRDLADLIAFVQTIQASTPAR
jgi:putative membrane-bound dehydrogenase-like protein